MDFFSPEAMKDAGLRLGKGAAVGAAVGVVADLALAGLSLGAATALGASIGGAVSQGWGPVGRKLANMLRDVQELTVEERVIQVLAAWQLALVRALEQRGHAAVQPIATDTTPASPQAVQWLSTIVASAAPARGHADWEAGLRTRWSPAPQRAALVASVAMEVRSALQPAA